MKRTQFAALGALLGLLAAGTSVERVGDVRLALMLPDGAPHAAILVVPGGSTQTRIADDGSVDNRGNFVMRIRPQLVRAGFAVAYVEDPSDLRAAIARLRTLVRPVVVLGTSNGSVMALANAARLGTDGADALILTSTVTGRSSGPVQFGSIDVGAVGVPTLFVHNANDACFASPPGAIPGVAARFKAGTDVQTKIVTSDVTRASSEPARQAACGPFSPHGYLGIEDQVATAIATWVEAHRAAGAKPAS